MKVAKIIVDIFMLVFIILSVVRWDGDPTFHIVVGSGCILFFTVHFLLNIKPLITMTKKFKKIKIKIKLQFIVDVFLIIVWGTAIITGFIDLPFYIGEVTGIGKLHGIFARVGCGISVIHLLQHYKQIWSYFKCKKFAILISGRDKHHSLIS